MVSLTFDDGHPGLTRNHSPEADAILGKPIRILDHGEVALVDYLGTDQNICSSARVSYGDGTRSVSDDAALIDYLYRNQHMSPFEACELVFRVKAPLFVVTHLLRHRSAHVNMESARYSVMSRDTYIPDPGRLAKQSEDNKQGSGAPLDDDEITTAIEVLRDARDSARWAYDELIGLDLARELARGTLTVANYTELVFKQDLRNLLHLIALRWDEHSQYETRQVAEAMAMCVERVAPLTYRTFLNHHKDAVRFSAEEMAIVRDLLDQSYWTPESAARSRGLKGRKLREFLAKVA